ncbi:MAG: hypothetical protein F4W91_05660, partial [Gemmatimonadetes bacterium]|nr:hypothetical protein [Gemmatimonadota bacterium]
MRYKMDYKELEAHRTVLLDLYRSLSETLSKEGDELSLELRKRQKNIEAEKFLLAIVGEAKAGKSTFINALLGEAMLPVGTLQATSEIIEIYRSKKKIIEVTFANGKKKVVVDDPPENEVVPILKKIASVQEEYRSIPIVQVNKFLIHHYQESRGQAVYNEKELENFISDPDLENIHNLDEEAFASKIRDYISKHLSCDEIPKSVRLGYPHDFSDFKYFRIVDTPGINARGGIEDQTKAFIDEADAVIYLHKAGPQESRALQNALENELPERVKDRLILVLTHKNQSYFYSPDDESEDEFERLLAQTANSYPDIGRDNIYFVDSLTELYLREQQLHEKTMDEITAIRKKNRQLRALTANCFEEADGNKYTFLGLLEKLANFDAIRKRIEKDAQNSASIQMKDFAYAIQEQHEVLENKISARIAPLKIKHKSPQIFAQKIQEQKDEMERMRSDNNRFTQELVAEFSPRDMNNKYYQEITQIANRFRTRIKEKNFNFDNDNTNTVRSYGDKLLEDYRDEMTRFVRSLNADFKKRIADKNVTEQDKYSITVPRISLDSTIWSRTLKAVEEKIKEQVVKESENKSCCDARETEIGRINASLLQNFWLEMVTPISNLVDRIIGLIQDRITQRVERFCSNYKRMFDEELDERQQYMEQLEKAKKTNEELKVEIAS